MNNRGFTLLEVLVATLIMSVAVVGLISNLSLSMTHAARLNERDRAVMVARHKMDELLSTPRLPRQRLIEGALDPRSSGGLTGGWRAEVKLFAAPQGAAGGTPVLERISLEVWWVSGAARRSFALEAYRRSKLEASEVEPAR